MDRKYKVDIDCNKENDEENNNEDDGKFDPIPVENTSSNLLLVLCHYGGSLILLDATYKTPKYSLFLFFLDIQTNVTKLLLFLLRKKKHLKFYGKCYK